MNYTRDDLMETGFSKDKLLVADLYFSNLLLNAPATGFLVLDWSDVPLEVRKIFCFNGGDEDWLVVRRQKMGSHPVPLWLEKTDTSEVPDYYDMYEYIVWVGSHS